jgi:hypothetical protein
VRVERQPINHRVAGSAVPGGVSAAAVTEAGDVTDQDLVRSEEVPVGHRLGGRVIHLPLAVRTRSPSTRGRLLAIADRCDGQRGNASVLTKGMDPDDRLAGDASVRHPSPPPPTVLNRMVVGGVVSWCAASDCLYLPVCCQQRKFVGYLRLPPKIFCSILAHCEIFKLARRVRFDKELAELLL